MNKHVLIVGVGLTFGCQPKEPDVLHGNPPQPTLPSWDDVKSSHPEGATNPPHPILIVTPDGAQCFKQYVGGMLPGPPDHVQACGPDECGTEVVCPEPKRTDLLAAPPPVEPPK